MYTVMEHLRPVIEQDRGDQRLPGFLLLPAEHGIKSTDGVLLQPAHRATPVQDKYEFC